jgi:hypothetical protein
MGKSYIYGLVCPISESIRYIGKTKQNLEFRLKSHIRESKYYKSKNKNLSHKHRWINKLISENIISDLKIILIEEVSFDNDITNEREKYWISVYNNITNLTNSTDGGDGVLNLREESKKKISFANSGEKNGMFGKRFTMSEEKKKKLSNSLKNSDKLKRSKQNPEFKKKISDSLSIPILILNQKFEIVMEFKNCRECSEYFNYTVGNIKNAIRFYRIIGKSMSEKYWIVRKNNYEESIKIIKEKIINTDSYYHKLIQ